MKLKGFLSLAAGILTLAMLFTACSAEPITTDSAKTDIPETTSAPEDKSFSLYVDCNATPGGDGSENAPFSKIPEVQAKIRELKSDEGFSADGINVIIGNGEYRLSEGLNFTAEDSGTKECPITYSAPNGGAILSGGVILSYTDFEPLSEDEKTRLIDASAKENVVKVDLSKYGVDPEAIETVGNSAMELFIDGDRATLARYPNDTFLKTFRVIDVGDTHEVYSDTNFDQRGVASPVPDFVSYDVNTRGGTFMVTSDIRDRMLQWTSMDGVYLHGYFKWGWSDSTTLIGDFDPNKSTITLSKSITYGVSSKAPFYFLNVYEELDSPGEFFVDKATSTLYLYKTADFESSELMLSALSGDIITATDLSHVSFKNLTLCATRGNGMTVSGNDILIDSCKIYNVRGGAITAAGNNITVQNSELTNLGSFGINISGGDSTTLTPSGNLVYNNLINNFGVIKRTYQSAVAASGCGVTVSHNEISESPHQAMTWSGPNHVIEYNEVYDVCLETSDCGALYSGRTFGSYGCVIRYNYIHDIGDNGHWVHAIYWDDGLSGQTAYGNLICNISSNAFAIGGGRDNVVENNLIINVMSNPISYDARTREALFDPNAWFTHNAPMASLIPTLRNEYWTEAFPIYGQIIPYTDGYTGDPDDPLLSANPANNIIRNNVTYHYFAGARKHSINNYTLEHCTVENNPTIRINHEALDAWMTGDTSIINDPRTLEKCPDFKPLPIDEMGRVE
ncbi:MAG: right-handed parallel beta-helix repeat-containing protein [Clostridia bacterium]|nr:right-handed parallel beta-helix repeat-containing protein [Clostridia bacterium]